MSYNLRVPKDLAKLSTGGGLVAIVLWSTTFALARSLSERTGPITAGAAVYLIGGALCMIQVVLSGKGFGRYSRLPRLYLVGCGSLFVFYTAAIYLAVGLARDRNQMLEIALLNYLWPALTIVLSIPILNKKGTVWLVPGTMLGLAGVFTVMTQGTHVSWESIAGHLRSNPAAYALALAAAVAWALYSNLARRWSGPDNYGAVELFIPVTGLALLGLRFVRPESTDWNSGAVTEAVALAVVTAVAYFLWDTCMRRGNLLLVAAFSYFTPLLSTLVSCIYLGIKPAPKLWLGCLMVVAGSLISWRSVSASRGEEGTSR